MSSNLSLGATRQGYQSSQFPVHHYLDLGRLPDLDHSSQARHRSSMVYRSHLLADSVFRSYLLHHIHRRSVRKEVNRVYLLAHRISSRAGILRP